MQSRGQAIAAHAAHAAHAALLAALAVAALAPAPAGAADIPPPDAPAAEPAFVAARGTGGFYLGATSGANLVGRTRSRFDTLADGVPVGTEYEAAAYAAGRLGYDAGPMFGVIRARLEAELGYADNAVNRYRVGRLATAPADSFGEARALQGYGNALFDIDVGHGVRPYVGGGVGVADVYLRRQGVSATGVLVDASDAAFAYHLDAGLGVDLSRYGTSPLFKGTTVELGYRWTQAPDLRLTARDGSPIRSEYGSNMVTLGTRKAF